jgi:hypothetical protein
MDETIDTGKTYMFVSALTGADTVLAAMPDPGQNSSTLTMVGATKAGSAGQWFLTRVNGNQPGLFYRVHPVSLGVAQSLDVVNQGGAVTSTQLKMAASGDSSGQAWRFQKWSGDDKDGFRLSNKLTGPDMHLDVETDTLDAHLFGGDFAGQHWTLASTTGGSATAASDSNAPFLSTGAIVGLAVFAGMGLLSLLLGLGYWMMRRRRRRDGRRRTRVVNRKPVELSAEEVLRRKESFDSLESQPERRSPRLQTNFDPPVYDSENVSPATPEGPSSVDVSRSDTKVSARTIAVGEVRPGSLSVVELPDRRY